MVVDKDQTCGVPGRFIGENVALLRDLVDFASVSGTPIAVLSLDQEKAFDRVDWSFMRATLSAMGFGPSFVSWVDLFYHRVQSSVNVNGYLSPFISLSRGVRQGCPLSPLLYVLVSEVLAVNIRSNPRIPGLCLPDSTVLSPISQYADDPSLICTSDDSIKAVFETYALFEKASGAKLNQSKSKGLWLGSWSGRSDPPVPLDWTSVKIKVLGVFIGVGNLEEANWRPRIDTVDRVLKSWRSRVLSFRGMALVINALAISRVWYVPSLIHMPAWVLKELSFLAFSFFWSGKRELVSRSSVLLSPLFGGFSVVNVKFKVWSLLGQWVKRFASSSAGWISFLTYWFYTAQRLVSFGLSVPLSCFCGSQLESLEHLFFSCPFAQSLLSWVQSLTFNFSHMCPVILCRHVLFGFSPDELRVTPRIFVYLLNVCKFVIWRLVGFSEVVFEERNYIFREEKSTRLHRERVFLTNQLIVLKRPLTDAGDLSVIPRITSIESQLSAIVSVSLEGAKFRSRVLWLEEGEKPSRYFFKLEKERNEKYHVNSILNANEVEVSDFNEVEQAHMDFYANLFSPEPIDLLIKEKILSEISTFLSELDRESCEGILSLAELTTSVKSLNHNKAPGLDGLALGSPGTSAFGRN